MADSALSLQAQNITCSRGYRDLFSGLNFEVQDGQVLRVEGENGSGKTSLLRILAGLAQPVEGEVLWGGMKIRDSESGYFSDLLYLGHKPGIKFELSAIENLTMSGALMGSRPDRDIEEALYQVGLYGFEEIPCAMLSAGQKRRVALAQLYLTRARLWILDEPYTSLDVKAVARLQQLFETHVNDGGLLLITSHQPVTLANCDVRRLLLPDLKMEQVA
jgi:heme exporter protein A